MVTMCLSRTVSKINNHFSQKSPIFPTPIYFASLLMGFPWNWVSALGSKNLNDDPTGRNKKFDDICLQSLWIQSTNVTDGWTDRHGTTAKTALTHSVARYKQKWPTSPCRLF